MAKRKFLWLIWQCRSNNYGSYEDFKQNWDKDTKIWNTIKDSLGSNVNNRVYSMIGSINTTQALNNNKAKYVITSPLEANPKSFNVNTSNKGKKWSLI